MGREELPRGALWFVPRRGRGVTLGNELGQGHRVLRVAGRPEEKDEYFLPHNARSTLPVEWKWKSNQWWLESNRWQLGSNQQWFTQPR